MPMFRTEYKRTAVGCRLQSYLEGYLTMACSVPLTQFLGKKGAIPEFSYTVEHFISYRQYTFFALQCT